MTRSTFGRVTPGVVASSGTVNDSGLRKPEELFIGPPSRVLLEISRAGGPYLLVDWAARQRLVGNGADR